jgi:uncharacterized metal-binding protein YceD (DUF177 family)
MQSKREYKIPFVGLKLDFHEFIFEIRDSFFEDKDYTIIQQGNVLVKLVLEKKETMMIGDYNLSGTVVKNCDRCNDPLEIPVKGSFRIIYKFGQEPSGDEALIVLEPETYELDVSDTIYELITVSVPNRSVHKADECNPEMLDLLNKYTSADQKESENDSDDEDWDDDEDDEDDEPLDLSQFKINIE